MIFDLESGSLPDGWTPLEAIAVVKCLDEDGGVALSTRSTDGLTTWEGAGMLLAAMDTWREDLRDGFERDDEDPD